MSEDLFTTETTATDAATDATAKEERGYPAPLLRFMPVSAGALAFGLAGAFDDVSAGAHTTCCGDDLN